MSAIKEFKVNDYITLRLVPVWESQEQEEQKIVIYVADELFHQCKFLLLEILIEEASSFDEIDSIDEAAVKLSRSQERNKFFKRKIPLEVEFWGHCSNLQVWAEYNYDTRLLHSNLAFPLLKKLTEAGDPIANRVFREEIAKRIEQGYQPVVEYLKEENYFKYLSHEELIRALIISEEAEALLKIEQNIGKPIEILTDFIEGKVDVYAIVKNDVYAIVKNRHIEFLSLLKCNLNNFPSELKSFMNIKYINLIYNQISTVPKWVLELKNLQDLLIGGNQIKSLPEWIGKLKSLKWLDIGYNPIEILPESIKKLENIEYLDVECCPLKQFPDLSSDSLPQGLKDLNFYFNDFLKKELKKKR